MKKVVKLSESDLTKIIKRVVNEADEPEPVLTDATDTCIAKLQFKRGQEKFGDRVSKNIKDFIRTCLFSSLATIERFQNDKKFKLPPIVTFHVGTSSSGTDQENRITAQKRMEYLTGLYMDVMLKDGIREDIAYELMTQSDKSYKPADVNRNFYDETRVEDKPIDRVCYITIEPITTKGKNSNTIGKIGGQLIDASSFVNTYLYDNVDEDELTRGIQTLETYSDLKDIDTFLQNSRIGKLQDFLNDQLFDDPTHLSQIKDHINTIAKRSGKGTVSQIVDGKISIILENKIVKLTESDLVKIVKKVIRENEEMDFDLKSNLNNVLFGHDPMNITSKEGEFGYLSGEHRLSKKVSPKQRIRRIEKVISQLEDYIQTLKNAAYGEQGYVDNPEYESNWGKIDSANM